MIKLIIDTIGFRVMDPWPTYRQLPVSWDINANNIEWEVDPHDLLVEMIPLKTVIKKNNFEITGDAYLNEIDLTLGKYKRNFAKFNGTGALVMDVKMPMS